MSVFPQVVESVTSFTSTDGTSHTINLPPVDVGDLLVIFAAWDGAPTITWPTGFTQLSNGGAGNNTARQGVAYKKADGTEGATATATTVQSEMMVARTLRIRAAHPTTAPAVSSANSGTSTAPNPLALDPANWATEDTLWIAHIIYDVGTNTVTGFPAGYDGNLNDRINDANGVGMGLCWLQSAVGSIDTAAFTLSASADWRALAYAIRPSGAVAFVPRRRPGRGLILR